MAAVLTTTMTMRIILSVRGPLTSGGSFALSGHTANSSTSRTTHVISTRSGGPTNITAPNAHTYTLEDMRSKTDGQWETDNKIGADEAKNTGEIGLTREESEPHVGVKVTIDKQVGYDQYPHAR